MSNQLDLFVVAFKAIRSFEDLAGFINVHGLSEDGFDQRPRTQIYRVVGGVIAGRSVKVTHRWHDPSQAFSIQPDVSKVDLDIDGTRIYTVEWTE